MEYVRSEPKSYKLEQLPQWWTKHWPQVKAAVNIGLHKGMSEIVIKDARTWIRIGDDISISVYSTDIATHPSTHPTRSPFHPGCLLCCVRIPIDWWDNHIEDVTDAVELMVKVKHER